MSFDPKRTSKNSRTRGGPFYTVTQTMLRQMPMHLANVYACVEAMQKMGEAPSAANVARRLGKTEGTARRSLVAITKLGLWRVKPRKWGGMFLANHFEFPACDGTLQHTGVDARESPRAHEGLSPCVDAHAGVAAAPGLNKTDQDCQPQTATAAAIPGLFAELTGLIGEATPRQYDACTRVLAQEMARLPATSANDIRESVLELVDAMRSGKATVPPALLRFLLRRKSADGAAAVRPACSSVADAIAKLDESMAGMRSAFGVRQAARRRALLRHQAPTSAPELPELNGMSAELQRLVHEMISAQMALVIAGVARDGVAESEAASRETRAENALQRHFDAQKGAAE